MPLSKKLTKFLQSNGRGYRKDTRNTYYSRITTDYGPREIEDLTLMLQALPEERINKIFTEKRLLPFLEALLCVNEFKRESEKGKPVEWSHNKIARLKSLSYKLIMILGNPRLARKLNPEAVRALTRFGQSKTDMTMTALQAIYASH